MMKNFFLLGLVLFLGACSDPENCATPGDEDNNGASDCDDPACTQFSGCVELCGNETIDPGEACDTNNLNNQTCNSQGFDTGNLSCNADCSLNTDGCSLNESCSIPGDEDEDGFADCTDPDCANDPSCEPCGNQVIDANEDCDGNNLNNQDCTTRGFDEGVLSCNADCSLNETQCSNFFCGDGALNNNESCDGTDLGANDCTLFGFDTGVLACNQDCTLNLSGCFDFCGDGVLNNNEDCDENDLGTNDCTTFGFDAGALVCEQDCTINISGCFDFCGDGFLNNGEDCDGIALGINDCTTVGFDVGALSCNPDCTFNTSQCIDFFCGDGSLNVPGEQCDDGNINNNDGCSASCQIEGVQEAEANNTTATATTLGAPDIIGIGNLPATDEDFFSITIPTSMSLEIETAGNTGPGSCEGDTFLTLFDTDGITPLATDDNSGVSPCSLLHVALDPGTYFIQVRSPNTTEIPFYLLFVTEVPPVCGNTLVELGEECDDGNNLANDGCDAVCVTEQCGDQIVNFDLTLNRLDECDDGNASNNDSCTNVCQNARCGDGFTQAPEQCDDANGIFNDGCKGDCTFTCVVNAECPLNQRCKTIEHLCVDCLSNSDCLSPQQPVCNVVTNTCRGCQVGVECPTGNCNSVTGACEP